MNRHPQKKGGWEDDVSYSTRWFWASMSAFEGVINVDIASTPPLLPQKLTRKTWKSMVGRCISFWRYTFFFILFRGHVSFRGCTFGRSPFSKENPSNVVSQCTDSHQSFCSTKTNEGKKLVKRDDTRQIYRWICEYPTTIPLQCSGIYQNWLAWFPLYISVFFTHGLSLRQTHIVGWCWLDNGPFEDKLCIEHGDISLLS